MKKLLILMLLISGTLKAETTWIPIGNGANFIIIPYIPSDKFSRPNNVRLIKLSNGFTITWDDIQHASKYRVEGLDSNGNWILLTEVSLNSVTFSSPPNGISNIRILACSYTSCDNSGLWSKSIALKKQIIFIHTDLLGSPVAETDINGNLQ